MSTEQNKSIVCRWVEVGWNQKNTTALTNRLYSPDYYQQETDSEIAANGEEIKQSAKCIWLPSPT